MSESPPSTIGKYQIIREIARSNDIVYEAYDQRMHRRVAVKELKMPAGASRQQQEDRLKRFEREARAAGSLVHPNIVTVYEVASDGDKHYIAMEYLTGRNLRKEIDKSGFIEPKRAVEILLEVLEGLAFAHENGIIHRDIKPDNVQLLDDGQIKLTDFGIARLTFEPNITMDGQVFGTPSYMSPEQINGQDIDSRSDIFSAGTVLYEMVAGEKPFQGDSVVSITYAIMNKHADQPKQANYMLWQVIKQALEKTPELRFRSAEEMIGALRQVQKTFEPGSVVLDPLQPQQPIPAGPVVSGPPPVFNPLAPQQAGQTPYGTPIPPQAAGVYSQPYLPGQQQPGVPYQAPAPTQVPVYYPPPPRTPLIKPEYRQAVVKFFIAVLLIGATIGFVILVINALSNSVPAGASGEAAPGPRFAFGTAADVPPATDLPESTRPDSAAGSAGGGLVENSSSGAVRDAGAGPTVSPARSSSDSRGRAAPTGSTEALMRQGADAVTTAAGTSSPSLRMNLWTQADGLFTEAIAGARSASAKAALSSSAANSFIDAANSLNAAGERSKAREALRHAKGFASQDAALLKQIDEWLDQIGG